MGKKTETVTTTSSPWSGQQPYLTDIFGQAQSLYKKGGPKYYSGNMVAPFSSQTEKALKLYEQLAGQNGQPNALNQMMTDTLSGKYLNSNPYLDAAYNHAADAVTRNYQEAVAPGIGAQFGSRGRYGSGLYQNAMDSSRDTLARDLGGMASDMYGQSYENERQNQLRAAALAPTTIPMNYYGASQLLNAGNVRDQQSQAQINADYNKYMFNQNRPWDALGRYSNAVSGNYGSQQTQTSPIYSSSLGTNLGLGLMGAGLAGSLYNNGISGTLNNIGSWIFG